MQSFYRISIQNLKVLASLNACSGRFKVGLVYIKGRLYLILKAFLDDELLTKLESNSDNQKSNIDYTM